MDFNKFKSLVSKKVYHAGLGLGEFYGDSTVYEWTLRGKSGTAFHITYSPSNRKNRRWFCSVTGQSRNNCLAGSTLDHVLNTATQRHVVDMEFPELRK